MLDELASGVPSVGAPDLERHFGVAHASFAVIVFLVPGAIAFVVEPIVLVLSDRYPRQHFVRGGLAVMAVALVAAALAPGPVVLAIALATWYIASGIASSLAQATLIEAYPERRARTMTRWTLMALAGDLGAPAMLAILAATGRTWRTGFAIAGGAYAVFAIATSLRALPPIAAPADDELGEPLWASIRGALRDGALLRWLFATALCDLLDEILIVFASLRMRAAGASVLAQSIAVGALVAGGAVGLVILDRALGRWPGRERRFLAIASAACAASYAAWLVLPGVAGIVAFAIVGATSAPLYPLAAAQAYAQRPGRPGMVLAASHLFTPLGLALPFVLGAIADRAGVMVALALLVAQPLGLFVLSARRGTPSTADPSASSDPR